VELLPLTASDDPTPLRLESVAPSVFGGDRTGFRQASVPMFDQGTAVKLSQCRDHEIQGL